MGRKNLSKIFCNIEPATDVFAGKPALFKLTVENRKKFLTSFLIKVKIGNKTVLIPVIEKNGKKETFLELSFKERGTVKTLPVTYISPFPFGFFYVEKESIINTDILIYPAPLKTKYFQTENEKIGKDKTVRETGKEEIKKIREYIPGDEMRNIHWKLSARKEKLFTKEFEGNLSTKPLIIELEKLTGTLEEKLSKATYLAIENFKRKGVGLKSGKLFIKPDRNPSTLKKILKFLALYRKEKDNEKIKHP